MYPVGRLVGVFLGLAVALSMPAAAEANPEIVAAIREALQLAVERSITTVGRQPASACGTFSSVARSLALSACRAGWLE